MNEKMSDIEILSIKERLLLLKGYVEGLSMSGCGYNYEEFRKVLEPINRQIGEVLDQLKEARITDRR